MNKSQKLFVTLVMLLLSSIGMALKVDHAEAFHGKKDSDKQPITKVGNSTQQTQCTKNFCMQNYGLIADPFNPACNQNATCWRQWYGLPNCTDDDITCWKRAVGYPKDCADDDYDCWIKAFGLAQCDDAQCIKDYLNYTCDYDDLECWRAKTWVPNCKWDDWDCWVNNTFMEFFCDGKKGYECVSYYYSEPCKQDDQKCWRKALMLPDVECEKDVQCFKKYYFLPQCKDDDFACWKKLYYGPDCEKGDMSCLKKYLFIPDCTDDGDEVQCYKSWLNYPDCQLEDGKCWKDYYQTQKNQSNAFWMTISMELGHKKASQAHMSFGKVMEHKRKLLSQKHKHNRHFHMKRAGLIK